MVEADGQAFGWATVRVTTVGEGAQKEFLRDAVGVVYGRSPLCGTGLRGTDKADFEALPNDPLRHYCRWRILIHTSRLYCSDTFRLYLHLEGRSFTWP